MVGVLAGVEVSEAAMASGFDLTARQRSFLLGVASRSSEVGGDEWLKRSS